jgi:hypothetical protein
MSDIAIIVIVILGGLLSGYLRYSEYKDLDK